MLRLGDFLWLFVSSALFALIWNILFVKTLCKLKKGKIVLLELVFCCFLCACCWRPQLSLRRQITERSSIYFCKVRTHFYHDARTTGFVIAEWQESFPSRAHSDIASRAQRHIALAPSPSLGLGMRIFTAPFLAISIPPVLHISSVRKRSGEAANSGGRRRCGYKHGLPSVV